MVASGGVLSYNPFSFFPSCQIDWKKGKNVTLKTIKKKQKHKGRGTVRTVTKTVSNDSFFNFFSPPEGKQNICVFALTLNVVYNWFTYFLSSYFFPHSSWKWRPGKLSYHNIIFTEFGGEGITSGRHLYTTCFLRFVWEFKLFQF